MKFNNTSFTFIIRSSTKENEGYIYLRKIKNRKKSYESLRLPRINTKFWNPDIQRVQKSNQIDHELFNNKIESKLKEIKSSHGPLKPKQRASLLFFFRNYLKSASLNHGTKTKYSTILKKLEAFRDTENYNDIEFKDFNVPTIQSFCEFMREDGLQQNTCRNYLKVISSIIQKAQKTEGYYNVPNHFLNYKYPKKLNKIKEVLSKEEIQALISCKMPNQETHKARNMFLFQLFSKGMRVSDLILLRYSNLKSGRLRYTMFKTKNSMVMELLPIHYELLEPFINFETNMDEIYISYNEDARLQFKKIRHEFDTWDPSNSTKKPKRNFLKRINPLQYAPVYIDVFQDKIPILYGKYYIDNYQKLLCSMNLTELRKELKMLENFKKGKGSYKIGKNVTVEVSQKKYHQTKDFLPAVIQDIKTKIDALESMYFEEKKKKLNQLATDPVTKDRFLFDYLPSDEFKSKNAKNNFSRISDKQYNRINKRSIVYNRTLKKIQKKAGISKNITSHLARISFTNLMLNLEGINIYDISKALGHSSIAITNEYLRTNFQKHRTDNINKEFIDSFK